MDLINRQDVIDAVTKYCTKYDLRGLLADIEVLPSIEPEIIYCKDCKSVEDNSRIADGRHWCGIHHCYMYYCSDAKRRTDE